LRHLGDINPLQFLRGYNCDRYLAKTTVWKRRGQRPDAQRPSGEALKACFARHRGFTRAKVAFSAKYWTDRGIRAVSSPMIATRVRVSVPCSCLRANIVNVARSPEAARSTGRVPEDQRLVREFRHVRSHNKSGLLTEVRRPQRRDSSTLNPDYADAPSRGEIRPTLQPACWPARSTSGQRRERTPPGPSSVRIRCKIGRGPGVGQILAHSEDR